MEQIDRGDAGRQPHVAFRSLRAAKNWFWWLLLLAVLIDAGAFVAVRYAGVLEGSRSFETDVEVVLTGKGLVMVEAGKPIPEAASRAENTYRWLGIALRFARVLGVITGLLLVLVLLLSVLVSLVGRLDGVGHLTGAMLWSILLGALLIPWETIFGPEFIPGVLFDLEDLIRVGPEITWGVEQALWDVQVLYYARFIGYPVLALLIWSIVQIKYAAAFRRAVGPGGAE